MIRASWKLHTLQFKVPGGTSRGVLHQKDTYFIRLESQESWGIGECGLLKGLSIDDVTWYEDKLDWLCRNINEPLPVLLESLKAFPSLVFGLEQAYLSLHSAHPFCLFPSDFTSGKKGIPINGLIWMGDIAYMKSQLRTKIDQGFRCIKLKIGALQFEEEYQLLSSLRKEFSPTDMEIRVDANGAFSPSVASEKLEKLAHLSIHSIEQPIPAGFWQEMAGLCASNILPIALDEELIGVTDVTKKQELLQTIRPQYLILKPSLIGGFSGSNEWIELAELSGTSWWITSALESNIGLNAIAQFTHTLGNVLPQGLGTGGLYLNNIESPLEIRNAALWYGSTPWDFSWETLN